MSNQALFTLISFNVLAAFLPAAMALLWFRPQWWLTLLTLFLGAVTGLLDLRAGEAQMTALLLLVFGFFAGFAHPRGAWRFGLLLGMWVPGLLFVALLAGAVRGRPYVVPGSCLAFIPAFLGAYLGVLVNRRPKSPPSA